MYKKISGNDMYDFYEALRQKQKQLEGTTKEVYYRLLADKVEVAILETMKWSDSNKTL
jgi:DNA-binding protein Fis